MLVRPLQLHTLVRLPSLSMDPVPWINIGLLALFWGFLETRYLSAPGLTLDLPKSHHTQLAGVPISAVLTAKALGPDGERLLLLFEGQIVPHEKLLPVLRMHLDRENQARAVLLIKADRNVKAQQLFSICELSREAGFEAVQLAAESEPAPNSNAANPKLSSPISPLPLR